MRKAARDFERNSQPYHAATDDDYVVARIGHSETKPSFIVVRPRPSSVDKLSSAGYQRRITNGLGVQHLNLRQEPRPRSGQHRGSFPEKCRSQQSDKPWVGPLWIGL